MFKALMGGGRSSSDGRSTASSSSKSSRRKTDSKSTSSRKSSRGDDRDRGLGDLSTYSTSTSGSRRGVTGATEDSVVSSYVTAEPEEIDTPAPIVIERTPKRKDNDRESARSRRRDRDRSESREREKRKSRQSTSETLDDDVYRERDRPERLRTQSGGPGVPPVSASMPSSAPGAQFATEIAAPGFSQFPMQYDNSMPSSSSAPGIGPPTSPYDPHVHQQFPGQFPAETAQPYRPPNPAGAAADYYGDQGQSVAEQPGVRPDRPLVIPNSQAHLQPASPSANPPPEPSSLGEVGAAAAYFAEDAEPIQPQDELPSAPSSRPPKPSKPSSSGAVPAAAAVAVGAAASGVGNGMTSYDEPQWTPAPLQHSSSFPLPTTSAGSSKPPHSYGVGTGIGVAAAGAAAGYMLSHHHDHASSPANSSQYTFQNFEQASSPGVPTYAPGSNPVVIPGPSAGYYPHGAGGLAMQHRHRGPLSKLVDFWRDPDGVGRFEDYTETIGVCKYCFTPGTSSIDAPRKHHYHHGRRHSADRYSSGSSSRVNKLNRYHSSEDERGRRKRSKKTPSWVPGILAGYAAKSMFAGKDFDDSYSVRSGRPEDPVPSYDGDNDSYTSRGVVRRSERSSSGEYYYHRKHHRRAPSPSGSRSRSASPSGQHSIVKEAALGAAVGSAALAVAKSHQRSRSRSPSRIQSRKESSSSSSLIDVSRPAKKSAGGFTSFFTSSSENRKRKKKSQRPKSFFSFRSSSSSSLDADLAFGSGFAKKIKEKKKKSKSKKNEDVDAALLGLGATATALAASSHGRSRSTGQILTARDPRSRLSDYPSSANNDDDEWVDADSEDQSSSSVSSALAFGASSEDSGSDSNSGRWRWSWGSKKKSKDKRSSVTDAALTTGAGVLGGAALASVARHRDSRGSSSAGSLQQVYPVPTSDPSRYDVAKMSSTMSDSQAPLVRPGPIPLQQPQPVTPVSQAIYSTQGALPGSIPAYTDPAAVPPIFANEYGRYDSRSQGPRDATWSQEDSGFVEPRLPRRSETSPVFPTQEIYGSNPKRRTTGRDQASVSFDLTEEQAERERRLSRRDRRSRDDFADEPVQLVDRESDLTRPDSERRQRRQKDRKGEKRESAREDNSQWIEAAAVSAIGAAAVSSLASRKSDDQDASEASSRRRERRRAERRRGSELDSELPATSPEADLPIGERDTSAKYSEDREKPSTRESPRQTHDDYADFFAPDEVRRSPAENARRSGSSDRPTIIEVVPASERQRKDATNDDTRNMPTFVPEPYENHDHLPWQVPRLNIIEPTPPQSINGSVRGTSSPIAPLDEIPEEPKERQRPSTGSRVSWGSQQTHEYEVPSSSEPEFSPTPEDWQEFPIESSTKKKSKNVTSKPEIGQDIEFAATVAAATEAAGFDPSYVIDDPKYHTRTSPPGSEDEGTFSPRSRWTTQQEQPLGYVEGEVETPELDKSAGVERVVEGDIEPASSSRDIDEESQRRDRSAIVQETLEKLNGNQGQSKSLEDDVFSMPGGFETGDKSRDTVGNRDDDRSVFSAPVMGDSETPTKSRKSRRSGDDVDVSRDTASPPPEGTETGEEKKKRRKRRSKRESDISANDDDRSAVTAADDADNTNVEEKRPSRQRKEEKRRQRYEDSVDAGRRQESEKV